MLEETLTLVPVHYQISLSCPFLSYFAGKPNNNTLGQKQLIIIKSYSDALLTLCAVLARDLINQLLDLIN